MEEDVQDLERPLCEATVTEVTQESSTVKRVVLRVDNPMFSFKAGQWVDVYIPGISIYTGYSMCSAPHHLEEGNRLELAVKYSDYPPTLWVHTKCKTGDKLKVQAGGTFFHEITLAVPNVDLFLLAAGIGINPMFSIYQHFIHMANRSQGLQSKLCLLYSAQTPDELIFKEAIIALAKSSHNVRVMFFSTRQRVDPDGTNSVPISYGRISASTITDCMAKLDKTRLKTYICGPPGFIDSMEQYCLHDGLEVKHIHYEKWW